MRKEVLVKIIKYTLFVSTIFFFGCVNRVDNGGVIWDYQKAVIDARNTGAKVEIDYECNSACLIKLSSGSGLCVSKNAKFEVHEPRYAPGYLSYDEGIRIEEYVNRVKELIPACAVKLFDSKGAFDRPKLTPFSGEEVLKSCPEIKECPEK